MKKTLAAILTLALATSTCTTALAVSNEGGNTEIPVTGTYQAAAAAADKIAVDITWDSMSFTYTAPGKGTWNPDTHAYDGAAEGGWAAASGTDPKIAVTNHSNVGVKADFAFRSDVDGLTGSFTADSLTLASADGTEVAAAPKSETTFSISGSGIEADKDLGTITVTVAKNASPSGDEDTDVAKVSNEEELNAAVNANKTAIQLTDNIALTDNFVADHVSDCVIDLNGFTLSAPSGKQTFIAANSVLTLKNGTLSSVSNYACNINFTAAVTFENCRIQSPEWRYAIRSTGKVILKNCEIENSDNGDGAILLEATDDQEPGSVTISGTTTVKNNGISAEEIIQKDNSSCKASILAGTYNFDPTAYVDTAAYTITGGTDGTWTVAEKSGADTPAGITTFEALQAAVNAGGTVILEADITTDQTLEIPNPKEVTLDLNHHTINGSGSPVIHNAGTATIIKNGTINGDSVRFGIYNDYSLTAENLNINVEGTAIETSLYAAGVTLKNCVLHSETTVPLFVNQSAVRIVDCTLTSNGVLKNAISVFSEADKQSVVTFGGQITLGQYLAAENLTPSKIVVEEGCNFDPASVVDEFSTVTSNGDGTWMLQRTQ